MFNFCMSTDENFASFNDRDTGRVVYVDSFDNREFSVRLGTVEETVEIGTILADSDQVLNQKLHEIVDSREPQNDNNSRRYKLL